MKSSLRRLFLPKKYCFRTFVKPFEMLEQVQNMNAAGSLKLNAMKILYIFTKFKFTKGFALFKSQMSENSAKSTPVELNSG